MAPIIIITNKTLNDILLPSTSLKHYKLTIIKPTYNLAERHGILTFYRFLRSPCYTWFAHFSLLQQWNVRFLRPRC